MTSKSELFDLCQRAARPASDTPSRGLSHAATLRIGKQLGESLSDLHKSGKTHGRLSPGAVSVSDRRAIWLDPSASPVVADGSIFAPPSSESTATGAAIQRDIYGFGATLTALSLGRLPSQLADGALDIYGRTVHLGLANVLDAATAPDPLDRFESVDEILEELDRLASLAVTRSSTTATATVTVNAGSAGSADSAGSLDSLVAEPDPVEVPWTLVDPGSGSSRPSRWTTFTLPTGRDLAQRPWVIAGALVAMAAVVVVLVNPGRHLIVDEREAHPLPGGGALAAVAQPLTKGQPLAMTRAADATDSSGSLINRAVVDPGAVPTRLTSGDASGGPAPLIGASTEGGPATKPVGVSLVPAVPPTPKPVAEAPKAVVPVAPSASPPAPAPAVGAASSPLPKVVSTVAPTVPQPVPPVVPQPVPPTIPRTVPATQPPPPPPPPAPTPPTTVDAVVRPGTPPAGPPTTVDAVVRPGSHPAGPQVTVDAVVRPGSAPAGPPTTVDAVRRP